MIPFLGTSLGAALVFFLKREISTKTQKSLTGFAAGVMVAASFWSLLQPALESSASMGAFAFLPASLGFLIGEGGSADSGGKIPPLLMASLRSGGKMLDPWNTPYKISIKQGGASVRMTSASGRMRTGYFLPNFYRLSEEERR